MDFIENDISRRYRSGEHYESLEKARARWDRRAEGLARSNSKDPLVEHSPYLSRFLEKLELYPGESVFDMGCGTGSLAVALAKAGHTVYAVDFSAGMLEKAREFAVSEGVSIQTFQRAWEEPWDDLPFADVAVASRSLSDCSLPVAFSKLERHAGSRVVVSIAAGESPGRDHRFLEAMGRPEQARNLDESARLVVEYLKSMGRNPKVEAINYARHWVSPTVDELVHVLSRSLGDLSPEDELKARTYVGQHAKWDARRKCVVLKYTQTVSWWVITWDVVRG